MVSSVEALAEQLPEGTTSLQELAANDFFARFWAEHDRTAVWLRDPDPPGERAADVARRFFAFARSLADARSPRPLRRLRHALGPAASDPAAVPDLSGPRGAAYAEAVELKLDEQRRAAWRFRNLNIPPESAHPRRA